MTVTENVSESVFIQTCHHRMYCSITTKHNDMIVQMGCIFNFTRCMTKGCRGDVEDKEELGDERGRTVG